MKVLESTANVPEISQFFRVKIMVDNVAEIWFSTTIKNNAETGYKVTTLWPQDVWLDTNCTPDRKKEIMDFGKKEIHELIKRTLKCA